MTDDLRTQLQTTLGDGYTLERELGGGGMSRVFVARENALGREVGVKLLAPELSTSVSATATIVCSRATGSESLHAQAR